MDIQNITSGKLCLPPFACYPGRSKVMHVWIYAGSAAWTRALSRAQTGLPVLALPHGRSPDSYCWPVSGFDVTVVGDDEPEDVLDQLAVILLRAGARLIAVVCGRSNQRVVYYRQCAGDNKNDR